MKLTNQVQAHSHSIGKVAIGGIHGCDDVKGQKVFATASVQGTFIRVFRLSDCEKLYELQRGSSPSTIHSMSFNMQASRMAVSSIKGTVHIFDLAEENQIKFPKPDSKNSIFKNFRQMTQKRKEAELNIIRSFARVRLKGEHARQSNTVSMLKTTKLENGEEEENIVIVLQDGKLFQFAVQSSGRKRPTRADDLMIRRERGHNM
jgi:WD40 repeat protein